MVITVYADRSYTFITKTPPVAVLIKREAGIAKGSGEPNKNKVGKITHEAGRGDREAEAARPQQRTAWRRPSRPCKGTARSMGVEVVLVVRRRHHRRGRGWPPDPVGALRERAREESMMAKVGKKYREGQGGGGGRSPATPCPRRWQAVTKNAFAKFDETVEVALRLGVDPKHADQMVRGTVILPHGLGGKAKKVLVIASGEKLKEAQDAGADHVGGEDMVQPIQNENWLDFDAIVATPDMMKSVGKLGKVLGPRGLMPNPKTGTVTFDVGKAVQEIKAGKVEYRVDKTGDRPRAHRQGLVRAGEAARQRQGAHRQRAQGQAAGGQGQVREVDRAVVHHGPRGAGRPRHRRRPLVGWNGNESHREADADRRPPRRSSAARRTRSWWTSAGSACPR